MRGVWNLVAVSLALSIGAGHRWSAVSITAKQSELIFNSCNISEFKVYMYHAGNYCVIGKGMYVCTLCKLFHL